MAEPFIGEVRVFAFNFAPQGWATCDGQILPVAQNQALFALLGKTYGGNGSTTFALPDLRGRASMHRSSANPLGAAGGLETVALTGAAQLPQHTHRLGATSTTATLNSPNNAVLATVDGGSQLAYTATKPTSNLNPNTLGTAGASVGHQNMQPSLVLNYCIALSGLFPSRP